MHQRDVDVSLEYKRIAETGKIYCKSIKSAVICHIANVAKAENFIIRILITLPAQNIPFCRRIAYSANWEFVNLCLVAMVSKLFDKSMKNPKTNN